jgi:mannosyltransferase OCH1-like enzyme
MIPKVVHYVWAGTSMPSEVRELIRRNESAYPEAQFVLWDDAAIEPIAKGDKSGFLATARASQAWAWVSDFVKSWCLYEHGGFVIDCDNVIVRPLDPLRSHGFVSGWENFRGNKMPVTAVMGSVAGHTFAKSIFDYYADHRPGEIIGVPNTGWISEKLWRLGIGANDVFFEIDDLAIYPSDVLCGPLTSNTLALHLFGGSWLPPEHRFPHDYDH